MKFLNGFKKKNKEQEIDENISQDLIPNDAEDTVLLFLMERQPPDVKMFFHDKGIDISEVYLDIEEAKIGMLMQSGTCRLVIVESGLGKFTTTSMRAELNDLLGMCDGIYKKVTVFYTDPLIKSDNSKRGKKSKIDWENYSGTMPIVQKLVSYKERYEPVSMRRLTEELESAESALSFIGEHIEVEENIIKPELNEKPFNWMLKWTRENTRQVDEEEILGIMQMDKEQRPKDILPMYYPKY